MRLVIISCQEMGAHSDLSFLLYFQLQQPKTSGDHQLPAHFCLHELKRICFFGDLCFCETPEDARRLVVADRFSQCTTAFRKNLVRLPKAQSPVRH